MLFHCISAWAVRPVARQTSSHGTGSPAPEVNADNFSARWTRDVDLAPGTYTVTATTDDGIRVYVDGNPVIDQWHDQTATTYSASVPLAAGIFEMPYLQFQIANFVSALVWAAVLLFSGDIIAQIMEWLWRVL